MRSLGLDPSLRSYGWVIYDSDLVGIDRVVASGHAGTDTTMVPVARYAMFRSLVKDLLSRFRVDLVGLESPAYGGGEFSERHFALMMFSSEAVFEARKDMVLYDPSTVKYLSTGNNQADKSDMQRYAQIMLKTTGNMGSDEIDALWVAHHAVRMYQLKNGIIGPEDLSKEEKRVFLQRTKKRKNAIGTIIKRTSHLFRENNRYFMYSKVPQGSILLPPKDEIREDIKNWLDMVDVMEGKF